MWDWASEQQAALEKAKIAMQQMKALGIAQAGLSFKPGNMWQQPTSAMAQTHFD